MYQCFDVDDASSGIIDPDMVRARRDIIQPFFSKGNIRSLEPFIFAKIDKLCNKIASEYGVPGQELPLDLASAFRCMSLDVITDFAFGKSIDALDSPGFENKFLQTLETSQPACWIFLHFKLVRMLMLNMPKWLANILSPDIVVFKDVSAPT